MKPLFEIMFLEEAFNFLNGLDRKHNEKILHNMRMARHKVNPELFKKLTGEIWECRTLYQGMHYGLLAFWDKTAQTHTLVAATHGFVKKKSKDPVWEIERAMKLRVNYYMDKEIKR